MGTNLYQKKYRIPSIRLPERDYTSGDYFITICTKNKECFFGEIIDGEMQLNELGNIANTYRLEISNHFPNVILDEFIIMPNHIHGILFIEKIFNKPVETTYRASQNNNNQNETTYRAFQNNNNQNETSHRPSLHPKYNKNSISSIINQFKGCVTRASNKLNINFGRQSRFYEHIIRDEKELNIVREYIINNPLSFDINAENNSDF